MIHGQGSKVDERPLTQLSKYRFDPPLDLTGSTPWTVPRLTTSSNKVSALGIPLKKGSVTMGLEAVLTARTGRIVRIGIK